MKPLKLRIWDKQQKRFFNENNAWESKNGSIDVDEIYATPISWLFAGLRFLEKENKRFVVQQFTGLKDKNGIEIYDGDIIKFDPDIRTFMKDSCIWENYGHIWFSEIKDGALISYNHPYSEMCDSLENIQKEYYKLGSKELLKYEVIGHINEDI